MACITPVTVRHKIDGDWYTFPCGKCSPCLKRRASNWSFRLMQESKRAYSAMFVTLTYDPKHVPITSKGYMTLMKSDVQKFFKRLRYFDGRAPIKYYAVGEYGTDNWRPHYHLILFNTDHQSVLKAWTEDGYAIGYSHYGQVSEASIGYCLKYMMKPSRIPLHKNDDRTPEFSLMSKGLGDNYMTEKMIKWHKADLINRMYLNVGEKKIAMPRFYKDKIYEEHERERIAHFALFENAKRNLKIEQDMIEKHGDNWYKVKMEQDFSSFEKMYKNALKNRKTV